MGEIQQELERRIFYLSALNDLGRELAPLQEMEAICAAALSVSMGMFGAMGGLVVLEESEGGTLKVCIQRGTAGSLEGPVLGAGGLMGLAGERVCDAAEVGGALGQMLRERGMAVWIPLGVEARFAGGMGLGSRMSGEPFTREDWTLLGTVRDSVSMALRNSALYGDLKKTNERLHQENRSLRAQLDPEPWLVSRSPRMQAVLDLAWKVAGVKSTVLLQGESGTGKEVIARAIHRRSPYREGPFVPLHCAALPAALLESELFGHEKGAFTGATAQRPGRFELADGGTLFLDEVGEIGPEVQVKLLRVLQERSFERVGGRRTIQVDVRVIAASNRDLEEAVRAGRFREDLYYRLNVVPIVLLPLRERREDLPLLLDRFLAQYCGEMGRETMQVSPAAMELLMAYAWPGNVRELQNLVERMVVVAAGKIILPEYLPAEVRGSRALGERERAEAAAPESTREPASLANVERRCVEAALARCGWNQSAAARILQISRAQLRHRIKQYGIAERPAGEGVSAPAAIAGGKRTPSPEEVRRAAEAQRGNIAALSRYFGVSRLTVYRWIERCGLDLEELRAGHRP
jgi:transcriptional regulator with GAF, ATPase, and Fis domain